MRLYIPLRHEEYEALERVAHAERRRPRDQAAVILAQVLAAEGVRSTCDPDSSIKAVSEHKQVEAARVSA